MTYEDAELDLTYALGEIQNIQSELETYFDPKNGIILQRLEGIEARLKELADIFYEYTRDAAGEPHYAGELARTSLTSFLGA